MRIGILGAGQIGATLGRLWVAAGHEICFGTRRPERLSHLVQSIGSAARADTLEEAVQFGNVVLLAVPLKAVPELAKDLSRLLANKVVIDAGNPYPERDGKAAQDAIAAGRGSSKWTASQIPGALIVKAFNMQRFDALQAEAHRSGDRLAIALAGDDFTSLGLVRNLVHDAGFEPVIVGSLEDGRAFDPGTAFYGVGIHASELRRRMSESVALRLVGHPLASAVDA